MDRMKVTQRESIIEEDGSVITILTYEDGSTRRHTNMSLPENQVVSRRHSERMEGLREDELINKRKLD